MMGETLHLSSMPPLWPPLVFLICRFSYTPFAWHNINSCLKLQFAAYHSALTDNSDSIVLHSMTMDSNASGFLLNPSTLHSVCYQAKEDDGIIDLGLSLRTFQPEAYHPSGHTAGLEGYGDDMELPRTNLQPKNSSRGYQGLVAEDGDEEAEVIQSKETWAYVKVNMDGVMVGRKICLLDHCGYSSLAGQLEEMFVRNSASGLRLFQAGSEFSLFYKDREDNWRTVDDVPWNEFVESVKRLRIARN